MTELDSRSVKTEKVWIGLEQQALAVQPAADFLYHGNAGGVCLFVGTTRRWTDDAETVELEYEAYVPMALKEMRRLADEAARRWPVVRVCLLHRLGVVPVAEASVVIGVATPHRAEAFEACRFLIDTLKQTVPIWKREVFADGRTDWVQPGNS